ncbi:MAG: iron-containing redox enzyme family protein [Gammaproteobacteria bacterium]
MPFHDELLHATETTRREFQAIPTLVRGAQGAISNNAYLEFLTQAYHHVKHTVPLLMACGARLPSKLDWLRESVAHYIEEEIGHERWILNDITAAGGNAEAVRNGDPNISTELMVAYAYDCIARRNPVAFFGMVQVLEGTSVQFATTAADAIQDRLGLPSTAFSYLRSHGSLDQEHIVFFRDLIDKLDDPKDQEAVTHTTNVFYRLYGDVFRSIPV